MDLSCEMEDFVETLIFASCVRYFDHAYYGFYMPCLLYTSDAADE